MSLLAGTRSHYENQRGAARLQASQALRVLGLNVEITSCGRNVLHAIESQWGAKRRPELSWDWSEIFRRYSELKTLDMAVWTAGERLAMVGLATASNAALTLRFVEGDPSSDCELKGKRILIALEVSTIYAQMLGLGELRIHPVNEALKQLYESVYGFGLVTPRGEVPYWSRVI